MKLILPIVLLIASLGYGQSKKFIRNIESISLSYDASTLHNNGKTTFSINVNTLLGEKYNSISSHKVKMHQYDVKCTGPILVTQEKHKSFTLEYNSNIDTNEMLIIDIKLLKDTSVHYRLEVPVMDYKNEIESIEFAYNQSSAYAGNTVGVDVISYLKSGEIIRTGIAENRIKSNDFEFAADGPAEIVRSSFFGSNVNIYLYYNSFMRSHPKVSAKLKRNRKIKAEKIIPIGFGVNYVLENDGRNGSNGYSGNNGRCGSNGGKYSGCDYNGDDGYNGENGDDGYTGHNGVDAANVIVRLSVVTNTRNEKSLLAEITNGNNNTYKRYVDLNSGEINIYARGGRGGRGGDGGNGGDGGCGGKGYKPSGDEDKKRGTGGCGGSGGRGGDGGNGGAGGDGGDVLIQYTEEAAGLLHKIVVHNEGGSGGSGGSHGSRGGRGKGGSGAYCGKDGRKGVSGDSGRSGYSGRRGQVNFIQLD